MRGALACVALVLACGHPSEPSVAVLVTCGDQARSQPVSGPVRIDEKLCGQPWTALRIEHGSHTELVKAVAGREVWLRSAGQRVVVEVHAGSAITSTFDGVTEIAEDAPPAPAAHVQIDANGTINDVALDDLRARFEHGGSGGHDISLCTLAAAYVAAPKRIEVTGEAAEPVVVTPDDCAARGLALKVSGKGELRLRSAAGDHLLQHVTRIRITL